MCFVVRKTTSGLECVILNTLYLAVAKNNDMGVERWRSRLGEWERADL
jgi:hypothetical protein